MRKRTNLVLVAALALALLVSETAYAVDLGDLFGGLTSMFSPSTEDAFKVGETAEIGKVYMTLNNVYESRGNEYYTPAEGNEYVILEFTVENGGEEEVTLSTMLSFSTWCDNKSCTISLEALGTATLSGKLQLDCVVAAGEKATGVLGYEVPADWQEISVKYTEEVMFGESAVFAVTREEE